jgi:hypothetical protein
VHLDGEAAGGDQSPADAATEHPTTPPSEQVPAAEALAREITRLEAHNHDLRAQLDDRAREIERLHTILSQTVRALPAPEPQPVEAPNQVSDPPRMHDPTQTTQEPERRGWWPRVLAWMSGA